MVCSVLLGLRLCPVQWQPRQGKGTGQLLVQPLPLSTVFGFDPFDIFDALQCLQPLGTHDSLFLGQLFSPPRIQALSVCLVGALPDHFVPPGLLQHQVLASHFISLLLRHGVIAPQSFLAIFFLKGLVLSGGLETVYSVIVSLAITGPHLFDTVHGRILFLLIPPLACPIFWGVPLLLLSWCIHGQVQSTAGSTRLPKHVIFGTGLGSACSAWPRLAASAADGQSGRSFGDNRSN